MPQPMWKDELSFNIYITHHSCSTKILCKLISRVHNREAAILPQHVNINKIYNIMKKIQNIQDFIQIIYKSVHNFIWLSSFSS